MSDNHDLLNDNDMCSFSEHEAEDMCFNCGDHTCGDSSTAFTQKTGRTYQLVRNQHPLERNLTIDQN